MGTRGTEDGQFANPRGIEIDSEDKVFVSDFINNNIQVFEQREVNPPVANAGSDQVVDSKQIVQLDGNNSSDPDNSQLSYFWNQTRGPEVTLSDPTSSNHTFTAPEIIEPIDLTFQLTVMNEEGITSEPDDVTITVTPTPILLQPVADAGPNQFVQSGDIVRLDGSNSSDPNDSSLTYSWTQVRGSPVELSDPTSSRPLFTAPKTSEVENLIFQLVVTKEERESSEPDEVTITVNPVTTPPPPPNEEPRTIGDIIKGIIQNPLDVTNSIDSANEIRDILSDNNRDNDQIVCDLIDSEDEYTSNIRELLNC
jgi:hypothetical protein